METTEKRKKNWHGQKQSVLNVEISRDEATKMVKVLEKFMERHSSLHGSCKHPTRQLLDAMNEFLDQPCLCKNVCPDCGCTRKQ